MLRRAAADTKLCRNKSTPGVCGGILWLVSFQRAGQVKWPVGAVAAVDFNGHSNPKLGVCTNLHFLDWQSGTVCLEEVANSRIKSTLCFFHSNKNSRWIWKRKSGFDFSSSERERRRVVVMLANIWDGGCFFGRFLFDSKRPYLPRPRRSAAPFDLFLSFKRLTIACFRQISGTKVWKRAFWSQLAARNGVWGDICMMLIEPLRD